MTDTNTAQPVWTGRLARWSRSLGITALVLAGGGLLAARFDLLPKITGFSGVLLGGAVGAVAALLALIALIINARSGAGLAKVALTGLITGGGLAAVLAMGAAQGGNVPAIHDITTDLANPPAFQTLKLPDDNLRGVETVENWRALHAGAYADIQPLTLACPASGIITKAEALAKQQGWAIAAVDAAGGRLEATAATSLFRFYDDVVLRVTPDEAGTSCRVDMRSVSRVGVSDLGANAKRIRAFLAALKAS